MDYLIDLFYMDVWGMLDLYLLCDLDILYHLLDRLGHCLYEIVISLLSTYKILKILLLQIHVFITFPLTLRYANNRQRPPGINPKRSLILMLTFMPGYKINTIIIIRV